MYALISSLFRMTGGGFGGCTVSLVKREAVDGYIRALHESYTSISSQKLSIFITSAGAGAEVIRKTRKISDVALRRIFQENCTSLWTAASIVSVVGLASILCKTSLSI